MEQVWKMFRWKERKSSQHLLSSYYVQFIHNTFECLLCPRHYAKF